MSGSVNKAIILGHLGRDPEIRSLQDGTKVANLSVATSERWTKESQKQERTTWHKVVIFNDKLAEVAEKYLRKGSKVYLEGQLQTRKWEKDGTTHYSTEVVLQRFRGELQLLDSKQEDKAPSRQPDDPGVDDQPIPF